MIEPRDEEPLLSPTTTRVGGGLSARIVALVVAAVLIGVVGFAVVNRPPAADRPVALAPAPLPTHSPPRRWIEGDDGIFGWPLVLQLSSYRVRRGPGLYNRCRWDIGPQAALPRPGTDEAGC